MTKAEAAGEPSMEDILASIRKIIAEEPPGSRAAPEIPRATQSAAVAQPFRPFAHDPLPEPEAAVTPEPYLRPQSQTAAFPAASVPKPEPKREPFFESRPAAVEPLSAPTSAAPAPLSPAILPASTVASVPESAPASVDDQLSDLLGAGPSAAPSGAVSAPPVNAAPDFINRMTAAPAAPTPSLAIPVQAEPVAVAPVLEPRPGFTVSRAGYVPEAAPEALRRDSYNFDLGPHPFALRQNALEPGVRQVRSEFESGIDARLGAADLGSFVPVRHADVQSEPSAPKTAPAVELSGLVAAVPAPAVALAPDPVAADEPASILDALISKVAEPVAVPVAFQVTAPVPEVVEVAKVAAVIDAENVEPVELAAAAPAVEAPVAVLESPSAAVETPLANIVDVPALNFPAAIVPSAVAVPGERTMEDTVAELLRPMLKTWLAENMPRIVERALRKEIIERNLIEHKTAAE